MNLQRREEIRELIAEIASVHTEGMSTAIEIRALDAMRELLAHIATLEQTAAERVIARGAVIAPHTFGEVVNQVRDIASQYAGTEQLRERIAYALAPHFEREVGPTPDYTGEGSAWVPPVEARAVVVPEVPMGTALQRLGLRLTQILDGHEFAVLEHEFLNPAIEEMQKLSVLSDRALGEGMVQISGRELACMRAELEYRRAESDEAPDSVLDPLWDAFNALRANQGGANE